MSLGSLYSQWLSMNYLLSQNIVIKWLIYNECKSVNSMVTLLWSHCLQENWQCSKKTCSIRILRWCWWTCLLFPPHLLICLCSLHQTCWAWAQPLAKYVRLSVLHCPNTKICWPTCLLVSYEMNPLLCYITADRQYWYCCWAVMLCVSTVQGSIHCPKSIKGRLDLYMRDFSLNLL